MGDVSSLSRQNSIRRGSIRPACTNSSDGGAWFPFGERNDPKLRRSFRRGVRYAEPVAPSNLPQNESHALNVESSAKNNAENEKPNTATQVQTSTVNIKSHELQANTCEDFAPEAKFIQRASSVPVAPPPPQVENSPEIYRLQPQPPSAYNVMVHSHAETDLRLAQQQQQPYAYSCTGSGFSFSSVPPAPPSPQTHYPQPAAPFHPVQPWHFPHYPWQMNTYNMAPNGAMTTLVPIEMMSGLPPIVPPSGSPQFVYATSINGQPIPVTLPPCEQARRRESRVSLPPINGHSRQTSTSSSTVNTPTSPETLSSMSWYSEKRDFSEPTSPLAAGLRDLPTEMKHQLQFSQAPAELPPMPEVTRKKLIKQESQDMKKVEESETVVEEDTMLAYRPPSPDDYRPIRPSPGGRYQIPDLPEVPPRSNEVPTAYDSTPKAVPQREKPQKVNNVSTPPSKKPTPSELGLFSSVEIRRPRRSDMLPPRPPTKSPSMTQLAAQRSHKTSQPSSPEVPITPPRLNQSPVVPKIEIVDEQENNNTTKPASPQESPRIFFSRTKQYRSFNSKNSPSGATNALEQLKVLKQKLLEHQQTIVRRDHAFFAQRQS
uniref:Uncharacterized protein n=1 Tax=Panagrellus redivivus TaxID=6233 RepID=A0A7E4VE64_PANRE